MANVPQGLGGHVAWHVVHLHQTAGSPVGNNDEVWRQIRTAGGGETRGSGPPRPPRDSPSRHAQGATARPEGRWRGPSRGAMTTPPPSGRLAAHEPPTP